MRETFVAAFGPPDAGRLARAPGRVNLIGEHVDYAGLPVFPMALQRHVSVLFRARSDDTVRMVNCDDRFGPRSFVMVDAITPYPSGDWGNYVKAAAQGLVDRHGARRGIDAVVCSTLPVAAGLSSSSALVIASALALLDAADVTADPLALAASMAEAERYVGTRGGGMDQAIVLGARRGFAFRIDFDPLRLTPTAVPAGWSIVVAHSLLPAPKSGTARRGYNERRAQCERALHVIVDHLRLQREVRSYADLLARFTTQELLELGARALDEPLRRRFRHVVSEGGRVALAQAAMAADDLETFGRLMNASHRSLRDDYEVSSAELDELVELARGAGAVGARLTGAGFGGCIAALCQADRAEQVRSRLAERFYARRTYEGVLDDHPFVAEPSEGASVTAV